MNKYIVTTIVCFTLIFVGVAAKIAANEQQGLNVHRSCKGKLLYCEMHKYFPKLNWDDELEEQACMRAKELASKQQWSHEGFHRYLDRQWYGETLAKDFKEINNIPLYWFNSPKHKQVALLHPLVGICEYKNYVVAHFASYE